MTRFLNSGRFGYSMGYKSENAAYEAFWNMCNEGELSEHEGKVESYRVRKDGREVTRYAITTAY